MDHRLTAGSVARLVDAVEHLPEALVVWDPNDALVTCNRQYARLFPEPSFVRPGIRFRQLVELNIDTRNVRSFATVVDVPGAPRAYRRVRRQAHSAGSGTHSLGMADGRWLQVSERRTDRGGVVGIYTDITAARWTDMLIWLSLVLATDGARKRPLTLGPRQEEILQHVHAGLRNHAIADQLGLAEQTVKNHVSRLIRRFGAKNRLHLVWLTRPEHEPPHSVPVGAPAKRPPNPLTPKQY
jgi:DNA-binding CsgD family transcriptional regulator